MRLRNLIWVFLWFVLLGCWACAQGDQPISSGQEQTVVEIGRSSASALMHSLKSHLQEAMEGNDPVAALEFCTLEAQALTLAVESQLPSGVKLKRTSHKFRNPQNTPDSIDSDILDLFAVGSAGEGSLPGYHVEFVAGDKEYRYYQPLQMGKLCLNCHGHPDQMDRGVVASLLEHYPQDRATGYQEGDFRGLIRVAIPEALVRSFSERPYLQAARDTARWIQSTSLEDEFGRTWPGIPGEDQSVNNSLYSGTPGVVLFFLELYHLTGEQAYLQEARSGADYLLATLVHEKMAGLYSGISGVGYALSETYGSTQDEKYREGLKSCLAFIQNNAIEKGQGIQWSDTTDIISGNAGTGLFLLHAARVLQNPVWGEMAVAAGKRLVELGQTEEGGLKWAMHPEYPRLMPNFSHGTAGIAYFLASLYRLTQQQVFLDSALAGARYLMTVADTEGDTCLIFHNEPDGEDLYYLGWCHGPVGTARLFYRLYQITAEEEWLSWMKKGARAILQSGIPEEETPGFWNNLGVCCGSAGVADFFLSLHEIDPQPEYLQFARRLTHDLILRGTRDTAGLKWIHAEHRSRPELLQAQTGLMQGAAGIGLWLLRLDAFDQNKAISIVLPDNPFGE
jgi:uncharacterized protein YyaL (SSP411 family)